MALVVKRAAKPAPGRHGPQSSSFAAAPPAAGPTIERRTAKPKPVLASASVKRRTVLG